MGEAGFLIIGLVVTVGIVSYFAVLFLYPEWLGISKKRHNEPQD